MTFQWNNYRLYDRPYRLDNLFVSTLAIDVDYNASFSTESNSPVFDMCLDCVENRYLISTFQNGSISIFDTHSSESDHGSTYPQIALIEKVIDTQTNIGFRAKRSPICCVQWYPVDCGMFVSASMNKAVKIWDTNRLKATDTIRFQDRLAWISMSPIARSHNLIGVAFGQSSTGIGNCAALIDPVIGSAVITLSGGHSVSGLTQILWSPRGSYVLVTAGKDGRILFWDIRFPSKPICSLDKYGGPDVVQYSSEATAHTGSVLGLTFTPDGLHLISWGGAGADPESARLRLWSSGRGDYECVVTNDSSAHNFPQLRPVNFGVTFADSGSTNNNNVRTSIDSTSRSSTLNTTSGSPNQSGCTSVRLAVAPGPPGMAWGASSSFVFVPAHKRLMISLVSKLNAPTRMVTRHFANIRACVWNQHNLELYTCGMDGNLFVWPALTNRSEPEDDNLED